MRSATWRVGAFGATRTATSCRDSPRFHPYHGKPVGHPTGRIGRPVGRTAGDHLPELRHQTKPESNRRGKQSQPHRRGRRDGPAAMPSPRHPDPGAVVAQRRTPRPRSAGPARLRRLSAAPARSIERAPQIERIGGMRWPDRCHVRSSNSDGNRSRVRHCSHSCVRYPNI